jgi:hypothetical protein
MGSYHQTQGWLSSDQVENYEVAAGTQEYRILQFFKAREGVPYSPERIQELVLPGAPLTSVRRALSNLTRLGDLVKMDQCTEGRYGRPVSMWILAGKHRQGQMRLFDE